jgi:hypothetical protein
MDETGWIFLTLYFLHLEAYSEAGKVELTLSVPVFSFWANHFILIHSTSGSWLLQALILSQIPEVGSYIHKHQDAGWWLSRLWAESLVTTVQGFWHLSQKRIVGEKPRSHFNATRHLKLGPVPYLLMLYGIKWQKENNPESYKLAKGE